MTLYSFTTHKYAKAIKLSKAYINSLVKDLSMLLDIQPIQFNEYKHHSVHHKLNNLYLIYDVMDSNITSSKATWTLIKIIMRGNPIIVLNASVTVENAHIGKFILGPLYINGLLICADLISNKDIYDPMYTYIVQCVLPELECPIVKHQV